MAPVPSVWVPPKGRLELEGAGDDGLDATREPTTVRSHSPQLESSPRSPQLGMYLSRYCYSFEQLA